MRNYGLGFTLAGAAAFVAAAAGLLIAGHTAVRTSTDKAAHPVPLLAIGVAFAVGMLAIRLIPPRLPVMALASPDERPRLTKQTVVLVATALIFAVLAGLVPMGDLYPFAKALMLLCGVLAALLIFRGPSPRLEHKRQIPTLWYWLGPLIAAVVWGYVFYASPLAPPGENLDPYRQMDPVELAIRMAITFLTASVIEEVFYRIVLQTRVEALLGRWPAIFISALLFAFMHSARLSLGSFGVMLATIIVWQGTTGLLLGYMWSRYRNIWSIIAIHGAQNALLGLIVLFT